jgi:hypothetical protein
LLFRHPHPHPLPSPSPSASNIKKVISSIISVLIFVLESPVYRLRPSLFNSQ